MDFWTVGCVDLVMLLTGLFGLDYWHSLINSSPVLPFYPHPLLVVVEQFFPGLVVGLFPAPIIQPDIYCCWW